MSELTVGGTVQGMIAGDFDGDKKLDMLVYGSSHFTLLHNFWNLSSFHPSVYRISDVPIKAVSSDVNKDGMTDALFLVSHPFRLKVFIGKRDTLQLRWDQVIPSEAEGIVVEDFDNDRKPDVLLFGKKSLGVTILLGNGDGSFEPPQILLDDYSLSAVVPFDLNGDRLEDFIAFDWIRNEILMFSSVGRLRFGSPSSISVPNGLSDMIVAYVDTGANFDLAVLQQEPRELLTFLGDGFGNFSLERTFPLPVVPSRLFADDVNADGRTDLIVFSESEKSFSLLLNDDRASFGKTITYAAGNAPTELLPVRRFKEKTSNIAILDATRRSILLYYSALESADFDFEQTYALGLEPRGICVFDVSSDKNQDILVMNNRSRNISVFLNRGNGTFYGQLSIPIDANGESIHCLKLDDSTFFLLTTHPQNENIVITKFHFPSFSLNRYSISTSPSPQILEASYDVHTDRLSLLVTGREGSSNATTISEFQEVERERFFERPFFSDPQKLLLAAAVSDMNHDGFRDIFYLARPANSMKSSLYLGMGQKGGTFSESHLTNMLPDSGVRDAQLWVADLNADVIPDLILQFHSDDDYLVLLRGKNDSSYSIHERFPRVAVKNRQDIVLVDIDDNGNRDIVLANDLTKTIQVFLSERGEVFSAPKRLLSIPGGGGFAVSYFNRDGIPDYAVVYSESGMLKVFLGKE